VSQSLLSSSLLTYDRALRFNVTLEALLIGHEGGVTNVNWAPIPTMTPSSSSRPSPHLLSTASDNSLILWKPSDSSVSHSADGIWIPAHRFGALGGRGLAFYGAIWGQSGESVMATGWNGGLERWNRVTEEQGGDEDSWEPVSGLNGHFGDVTSCTWDPRGDYLLSVG
jgi:elongator complex protein 2